MIAWSPLRRIFHAKKIYLINTLLILLILGAITAGKIRQNENGDVAGETTSAPRVRLVHAGDYRTDRRVVVTSGVVESRAQVEIKAQANAPVARINVALGQTVRRGQTLLTLENRDLAAQLAQAEATLQLQEVRLKEVKRGPRSEERAIAETGLAQVAQALAHQQEGVQELLTDAYAKTEDAVRVKTDGLFSNDDTASLQFTYLVTDAEAEARAKDLRLRMTSELGAWQHDLASLPPASAPLAREEVLRGSIARLNAARDYFTALTATLLNPAGIAGATADAHRLNVSLGRTAVNGLLSAFTAYERALAAQKINVARIEQEVRLIETGASQEQIEMQEAVVAQARAGLQLVSAHYQKTIIRAPFSATVADIQVNTGDLASFGMPLISLVNTDGLKVHTFVSGEDAPFIEIGSEAAVDGIRAVVAERSPRIDPGTKKVEVVIVIPHAPSSLMVGQSVDIRILPAAKDSADGTYLLPIQAMQINPQGAFVFTVSAEGTARAMPVELGETEGESVEVKKGLSDEMEIISTVQDLKDGDRVEVEK